MHSGELFFMIFGILGGLALFILGMNIMSTGLRLAAGNRLRRMLGRATRNRFSGIGLGTLLGFLVHSSATTVMLVGFVNAGLITLAQSIPATMGANIGTTLSMQLVSFRLGDYAFVAIALGFIVSMAARNNVVKNSGRALMGFGLLFLGMSTMSGALAPYRDLFRPWLAYADGTTLSGILIGIVVSAGVTAVIQSSGATIGMGFALISAGVVTDLQGIFPIILGAHIGTCVTALLGSLGAGIDARRAALAHLFFNIYSTIAAALAAPLFYRFIPLTSDCVIRQAANADTVKMFASAIILLPFASLLGPIVERLTPSKRRSVKLSRLDHELLNRPEMAIYGALKELQRVGEMCIEGFALNAKYMVTFDPAHLRRISIIEENINEIKAAMKDYVFQVTKRQISRRQAILLQHVDRCMSDIERIGDHVDRLSDITFRRRKVPAALVPRDLVERWYDLHRAAQKVLELGIQSLDPDCRDFATMGRSVLAARDDYDKVSRICRDELYRAMESNRVTPLAGVTYREYLSVFDRMVKHMKSIAQEEMQTSFQIKIEKLDAVSGRAPYVEPPEMVDPDEFIGGGP